MMKPSKFFLLFFGLLFLVGGAGYLFRDQLLAPVLRRVLVRAVAAQLGLEVTVASISGTYLRDLHLTGVRTVRPSATGMLVSIEAADIQAGYSLPLLRHGVAAFLGSLRLELDGARVVMDFTRAGEEGADPGKDAPRSALLLPVARVRDSRVALRGRGWALTLSGTDLTVGPFDDRQGGFPLAVHAARSVIGLPALRRQTPELAARGMLCRDSVRVDRLEVNGEPAIAAARFAYGPAEPFSLALAFTAFGGSGKIHGVFAEEATELAWDLRTVDLAAVARLLVRPEMLPTGRITSSGSLVGDLSDPVSLTTAATLALTDGTLRTIPFKHVTLTATSDDGILHLASLAAETDRNVLAATGLSLPLAPLVAGDAATMLAGARGRFSISLEDIPSLLRQVGLAAAGAKYLPGGMPAHRLVVAGEATADGITLESGTFSAGRAAVELERTVVRLPRSGPLLGGLGLSGKLAAKIPDLGEIGSIFGVGEVAGSLAATVTFDGPLANLEGAVAVQGRDIRYRAGGVDSLLLAARSGPAGWRIDNLEATHGADRLAGHGIIALAPVRFDAMVLDLTLRDFQPYLGWFMAGDPPPARGGMAVHLEVSGSPLAPTGSFRATLSDGTIGGVAISGSELVGTMAGEKIAVASLTARTEKGRVELAGSLHHRAWGLPVVGTIERLALDYGDLRLDLREPVAVTVHGKTAWSLAPATLQGDGGTLRLGGGVSPGKGYDIALGLSEVSSEFLRTFFADLPFAFRGLNLAGTLSGPLDAPEAALSGSVTEVWSPEEIVALAGQFAVRVSSRGIVVQTFSWTTKAGERIVLVGTAPYDPFGRRFIPGKLDLAGDFSIPDLGVFTIFLPEDLRMRGSLTGTLKISGTGPHPEAAINFHATDIRLPAAVVVRPPGPVTVEAEAVFKDNDLRIVKLAAYSKDFSVSVAGDWRAAGALLKGRPAAGLPGTLDLKATVMVGDIGWLGRGLGGIRRLGGHLAGTMTLAGPAASPDLTADISFAGGEFRAEGDMPPLRDIQAQLRIAQRTATIDRFTGTVGGSPFAVAGRVVLPGTGPPEADLRVHGANLLLYRSEGIKVRADTDITVRGTLAAPAFAGTIALTDSWLQKNVNWLEPLRDIGRRKGPVSGTEKAVGIGVSFHTPPLRDATFDIHLLSKNPFRIKSNVARGRLRPDLRLRGTGEVPLLTGVIYVDSSRIMLPAGRLTVESGLIRLPAKNLGRPVLEISGASRIFGYDINVMIEGPYDDPVVTLSSVPPLPQDALLLLLLTGRLPPGLVEQAGGWQGGISVALYVSKGVLQEWFGGNDLDAEESRLERFDVVIGRGISRQGNETIGAQYRLADDVIKDGDELYLVAERDVYDEFNTGIRIVFKFQ